MHSRWSISSRSMRTSSAKPSPRSRRRSRPLCMTIRANKYRQHDRRPVPLRLEKFRPVGAMALRRLDEGDDLPTQEGAGGRSDVVLDRPLGLVDHDPGDLLAQGDERQVIEAERAIALVRAADIGDDPQPRRGQAPDLIEEGT